MAGSNSRAAERDALEGEDIGNSLNQVAQGLAGLQEALRKQTQESLRRQERTIQESFRQQLQEVIPQSEQRIQEQLRQQMQQAVHQQERRMKETLNEQMLEILRQQDKLMLEALREEMQENLAQQDQIMLETLREQMLEAMANQEQKMKELVHQQTQDALLQQGKRIQDILRQQMEHALRHDDRPIEEQLVEKAQQEERMMAKVQEMVQTSETRIARAEQAVGALTERLENGLRRVEDRLGVVETREPAERDLAGSHDPYRQLENRMIKLEDSVQRAIQNVFPRVEALVSQLGQTAAPPPDEESSPSPPLPSSSPPPLPTSAPPVSPGGMTPSLRPHATSSTSVSPGGMTPSLRPLATSSTSVSPGGMTPSLRPRSLAVTPTYTPPAPPRHGPERRAALRAELCRAVVDRNEDEVRRVLDAGASVNFLDANGWTPLTLAAINADTTIVSLLLGRGATVAARSTRGHTALHFAASRDRDGACINLLLAAGAPVDAQDVEGWTPLHHAAKWNNEAAVMALLAAGANVSVRDEEGRSAYDIAPANALRLLFHP